MRPVGWLSLFLIGAAPGRVAAGELADVTIIQAFEPVRGVRLLEVVGRDPDDRDRPRRIWLMISEAHYARLVGCAATTTRRRTGTGLQYSDRSRWVVVVVCG